ncbi:MAG: hypothetical protein ACOYN1_10165 [Polynucleobacter sp.]
MIRICGKSSKNYLAFLRSRKLHLFTIAFASLLLTSCAGEKQSLVYDTFKLGISSQNTIIDETPLNPNYRYLKVDANGLLALLVLGYVDQKHKQTNDIWYSAFKEVIEIKGGRLGNSEGLELNWTEVDIADAPSLSEALTQAPSAMSKRQPKYRYTRTRTVMPGYQVNIRETVVMEALNEIPSDAPKQLKNVSSADIRWVQETVLVPTASHNPSIKPLRAIYAIDSNTSEVIFGKQYLTPDYYISWLAWPYPKASKSTTRDSTKK